MCDKHQIDEDEEYKLMYTDYCESMKAVNEEPESFEKFKIAADLALFEMANNFDQFCELWVSANYN
jgi:hypothetical protein